MKEAYARLLESTGTRTQMELAEFLGISRFSVSKATRRGHMPDSWLITALRKRWINPAWILTGEGAKFLAPAAHAPVSNGKTLADYADWELSAEMVRRFSKLGFAAQ